MSLIIIVAIWTTLEKYVWVVKHFMMKNKHFVEKVLAKLYGFTSVFFSIILSVDLS
jgi:hypothetical protein